jgi:hypothetical protein
LDGRHDAPCLYLVELLERLAALTPRPRVNLIRAPPLPLDGADHRAPGDDE